MTGIFLRMAFGVLVAPATDAPLTIYSDGALLDRFYQLQRDIELITPSLLRLASDTKALPLDRQAAIVAIGQIRSPEAVAALLQNLLVPADSIAETHPTALYPAATCIIQIGSAAHPRIWERLRNSCSDEYLHVIALVLTRIDGKSIASIRVQERLASIRLDTLERRNLEHLLDLIQTLDFSEVKNWRSGAPKAVPQ